MTSSAQLYNCTMGTVLKQRHVQLKHIYIAFKLIEQCVVVMCANFCASMLEGCTEAHKFVHTTTHSLIDSHAICLN